MTHYLDYHSKTLLYQRRRAQVKKKEKKKKEKGRKNFHDSYQGDSHRLLFFDTIKIDMNIQMRGKKKFVLLIEAVRAVLHGCCGGGR